MNDPIALLVRWIEDAGGTDCVEAVAMCLATADATGKPSSRIVLLRGVDDDGLRFFTSYSSRKGRELAENPLAAATFYWPKLTRQVRIEGSVTALSESESDAYFQSRPRGHQLAAWASEQSEPIDSPELLEERFAHFDQRFEGEEVPRPHSWGGYLLVPSRFEFWQGRPNRMHERIVYARRNNNWEISLLQP
jgi:pyridoxamine 5'-phosphate oxidase